MLAGTATATATATATLAPAASRYRRLRGKSVSAPRASRSPDIFRDHRDFTQNSPSVIHLRRRSKSVTTLATAESAKPAVLAPRAAPEVPPVPAIPASASVQPHSHLAAHNDISKEKLSECAEVVRQQVLNKLTAQRNQELSDGGRHRAAQLEREAAERRCGEEEEAARWADEVARLEAETDKILAEQKRKDIARLQAQLARAQILLSPQPKARSPVLEKFSFLSRSRRSNASHATTMSPISSTTASIVGDYSRATSLEPSPSPKTYIEPGGRGIVPQTDAPTSASNAKERVSTHTLIPPHISMLANQRIARHDQMPPLLNHSSRYD